MDQALAPCLFDATRNDEDPPTRWVKLNNLSPRDIPNLSLLYESLYDNFPDPATHYDLYVSEMEKGDPRTRSPFFLRAFKPLFMEHPDRLFAKAVAAIIAKGAFIGYFGPRSNFRASTPNYIRRGDPDGL